MDTPWSRNWLQFLGSSYTAAELREKLKSLNLEELLAAREDWPEISSYLSAELGPFVVAETVIGGGYVTLIFLQKPSRFRVPLKNSGHTTGATAAVDFSRQSSDISREYRSEDGYQKKEQSPSTFCVVLGRPRRVADPGALSYPTYEFAEQKADGTEGDYFYLWLLEVIRPR